jgi:1-acyl-sn-glycerol-3-phosphate acyltransferase
MLRLILVLLFLVLYALAVWVPLIFHAWLTGKVDRLYWAALGGVKASLGLARVRVRAEGLENIPPGACVFAANHTSNADPLALVPAIPRRISILVKKELFRVPILGTAMKLVDFIPVDRTDREAAAASVDRAVSYLERGLSFLVYPEGTRSPDGRLGAFKKGAFILAIRARVPVVPIAIAGAEKVMRKGSPALYPGEILVRFLPAVDSSGYSLEEKDRLLERVRAAIASALPAELQPNDSAAGE